MSHGCSWGLSERMNGPQRLSSPWPWSWKLSGRINLSPLAALSVAAHDCSVRKLKYLTLCSLHSPLSSPTMDRQWLTERNEENYVLLINQKTKLGATVSDWPFGGLVVSYSLPFSVHGWTLAFLLHVHRLRGDWDLFCYTGSGWVGRVWSARKNSLKYSAIAGYWTRAIGRTDSEIHSLFHWTIMTDFSRHKSK